MVLSICKNNRTIFNIFIILVSIGGFFSAMNGFAGFIASLRVNENYVFSRKLLFHEIFTNVFRLNISNTFPFCDVLL